MNSASPGSWSKGNGGGGPRDWLKLLQTSAPAEGEVKGGR